MTNIRELAQLAGVSKTTVSRVLNDHPYVSEEKRQAVLKAMSISNYQKNINAVHLSKGKTFLIGVVLPFSNHTYFSQLMNGMAKEALENNYKLVLFQTNYEENREIEALNMLKHKLLDAVIICSRVCEWNTIHNYLPYGPIILCEDIRETSVSSTFVDHYKTFSIALDYLFKKGHEKIGYCIGRRSGTNSQQREHAYRTFFEQKKIPFHPDYIFDDCLYFEDSEKIVERIRHMDDPPTALLVTSDQVAAGIVTCCQTYGLSIPDDLAIIGFDNQPIAKMMGITTIEIPLEEIGRKLFHQAINNEHISHQEIAVKLIERKTV